MAAARAEGQRQVITRDVSSTPCWQENSEQRSERAGMMKAKVRHPTPDSLDGRQQDVPRITMGDTLIPITVLLCRKVEVNSHCCGKGSLGNSCPIEGGSARNIKGCVAKAKGVACSATVSMFPRTEQEEIANDEQVRDGRLNRIRRVLRVNGMTGEGQRDGFDPHRGRVTRPPGPLHLLERRNDITGKI